jgi:hypothetical protein
VAHDHPISLFSKRKPYCRSGHAAALTHEQGGARPTIVSESSILLMMFMTVESVSMSEVVRRRLTAVAEAGGGAARCEAVVGTLPPHRPVD